MIKIKYTNLVIFLVILLNFVVVFYFTWNYVFVYDGASNSIAPVTSLPKRNRIQAANKHIKKSVTIIIRDVFHFENDIKSSIESILNLVPNVQIMVLFDENPYPPLDSVANLTQLPNVQFIQLGFNAFKPMKESSPLLNIKTKYVLFIPDSVRLHSRSVIQAMIREGNQRSAPSVKDSSLMSAENRARANQVQIIPFSGNMKNTSNCCTINLDFSNWTITYVVENVSKHCDMFLQKHAIFVETSLLQNLPEALSAPFPEMFYIQTKLEHTKNIIMNFTLQDGKKLFTSYHSKQKRKEIKRKQFKEMYKKFQIKKVVKHLPSKGFSMDQLFVLNGKEAWPKEKKRTKGKKMKDDGTEKETETPQSIQEVEFYGCEKNTKSCIGPVYNRMPFYVYIGKHTPPCCMEKLKSVFLHVIDELETVGIRYWLDNLSLKDAITLNAPRSDAYEIDISFNVNDLERSSMLKRCQMRPYTDNQGFYWLKATDGHYFKVQFSKVNQINVNLLPYDIKLDRVEPNGFFGWKSKEFSLEFLHPMTSVVFLGKSVSCPNNVVEYLDFKHL